MRRCIYPIQLSLFALAAGLVAYAADARVTKIEAEAPKPMPAKDGSPAYELVSGIFHGELDPKAKSNRIITDIEKAPRNKRGMVEYSATFSIARPVDNSKSSGLLFYQVPNRGGGVSLEPDADGHIRVISGWQGDLLPEKPFQYAAVPIATGKGGKPITGRYLTRISNIAADAKDASLSAGLLGLARRPAPMSLSTTDAELTIERAGGETQMVAAQDWAFADCRETPFPGKPDAGRICLKAPFETDVSYRLVYTAKDPLVLGVGFAATRDLVAFLRSGKPDDQGHANPAGQNIRWAIGQGNSQSGNFLRAFLHLGFNADEAGNRVFDGMNPNIAARLLVLNLRFANPGGASFLSEPGSEGPLWWTRYNDTTRSLGETSLLARCTTTKSCPKIIDTIGSAEFWGLRASPGFVGTDAKADLPLPDNVRRYYFPSVTHGGSYKGGFPPQGETGGPFGAACVLPGNPASVREPMRVAWKALIDWVVAGKEPPASVQPTIAKGDLVKPEAAALGWPAIPGAPVPDGKINPFYDYDFGPGLRRHDLSGTLERQPPLIRRTLPMLVPRVDADGNEIAGVKPIQLRAPLGTYTGWNVAASGRDKGKGCGFAGGFIPFARTNAEREAKGDPRLSLEERYGDHAGFVLAVRKAAEAMQAEGWLLPDDAERLIKEAEDSDVLR